MTDGEDPTRWAEGGAPNERLAELVAGCRKDVATDAELAALLARLSPVFATPPAPQAPPAGGEAAAPAAKALAAKALIAGGAAITAAAVWFATREAPQIEAPPAAAPPSAAPVAELAPPPQIPAPAPATAPTPPPSVKEAAAPPARAGGKSAADAPATRPGESDLLGQAQLALGRDPARAFALAEQHRRTYPGGVLVQEREVIAIDALRRLGRAAESRARAERFLARYPKSAHRSKVLGFVETK